MGGRRIPEPGVQAEFEPTVGRVQQLDVRAALAPTLVAASPSGPTISAQSVGPQAIGAQSVDAPIAPQTEFAAPPDIDPALLNDPSDAYTEEVKKAVIDAMIENSGSLVLGENEWLTVAARDNAPSAPFISADPDVVTLVLRVKGSDLSAFRAGRLTLDEIRSRVQIGEF